MLFIYLVIFVIYVYYNIDSLLYARSIPGCLWLTNKSKGELNIHKLRYEHPFLLVDEREAETKQLQGAVSW